MFSMGHWADCGFLVLIVVFRIIPPITFNKTFICLFSLQIACELFTVTVTSFKCKQLWWDKYNNLEFIFLFLFVLMQCCKMVCETGILSGVGEKVYAIEIMQHWTSNAQYKRWRVWENNIFMYYLDGLHPHSFGACLCLSALSRWISFLMYMCRPEWLLQGHTESLWQSWILNWFTKSQPSVLNFVCVVVFCFFFLRLSNIHKLLSFCIPVKSVKKKYLC